MMIILWHQEDLGNSGKDKIEYVDNDDASTVNNLSTGQKK